MWVGDIERVWVQEITQEKLTIKVLNYTKSPWIIFVPNFELCHFFMYNFNSRYIYCLQEQWANICVRILTRFVMKVLGKFDKENHKQKISNIIKPFLNYTTFSWRTFYDKLSQNPNYFLLHLPIFMALPDPAY